MPVWTTHLPQGVQAKRREAACLPWGQRPGRPWPAVSTVSGAGQPRELNLVPSPWSWGPCAATTAVPGHGLQASSGLFPRILSRPPGPRGLVYPDHG